MPKSTLLATLIAVATLFGAAFTTATSAQAGSRVSFGVTVSDGYHDRGHRRGGRDFYRGDRDFYRGEFRRGDRGFCRPRRALRKARRMGVRRAYVHRVGRRGVVIGGRKRGEPVRVGFGRAHYCPVRFARYR